MNTRLNVDRFKTARLARAKGLAGASTLLHGLLDRTRAGGTLSDLASRWKRSSPTTASDFTRGLTPTPGADLFSPDALRDLLDRMGQIGSARALDGTAVPTRAPAPLPEGAQFLEKTYSNAAGRRPYKLYVPSCYKGQPLPLVVMLHGCTQSPDDFAAGTRMNALAEEHVCLIAYPGQTPSANSSKCWNWFSPQDQRRDRRALTHRRDHTTSPKRLRGKLTTHLHRRPLGRRRCGEHYGCGVPRPLCGRWSAFRPCLWVCPRRPFCLCRNEARWAGVPGLAAGPSTRADANDHLPR